MVTKGHLIEFIDYEKTREKAGGKGKGPAGEGMSSEPSLPIINVIHGAVDKATEAKLKAKLWGMREAMQVMLIHPP